MTALTARRTLRLGTRGSALARAQASLVAAALERASAVEVRLVEVRTEGDRSSAPLTEIGGQGVFTGAVRDALVRGEVDLAVHSLKDLPTTDDPMVQLVAVPPRGDARDALVARSRHTLASLPAGSRVGTGSPRRTAQLRSIRPDLDIEAVRGNVDTRLRLVSDGRLDGVVLAMAGLERLDRAADAQPIDVDEMLPAPGQGALAVEVAATAPGWLQRAIAESLDDPTTRASVTAERSLLATLEAGCSAPVGAFATVDDSPGGAVLHLAAVAISPDGTRVLCERSSIELADRWLAHATELGRRVATVLLHAGASELLGPSGSREGAT